MYKILYENPNENIINRLLHIRWVDQEINDFLNPTFSKYRLDPLLLNDMEKSINRILVAIKKNEKIVVFWDYDVDWICSTYILYVFINKFLNYKNISIRLPNRLKDWYWIRTTHIDELKKLWVKLIVTVDNWITSIEESNHCKVNNIDLIITDHHKPLDILPDAFSIVNPLLSQNYPFKWIAWVWVAFKLINWIMSFLKLWKQEKKKIFNYLIPFVSIWTIADCVPLINENRIIVKYWLDLLNKKNNIPKSLINLMESLNISNEINSFDIWFKIAPRLNAWWRMDDPYISFYSLLYNDIEKQKWFLEKIDKNNQDRRKLQEKCVEIAKNEINISEKILVWMSPFFHEWILWLVASKFCEQFYKPCMIVNINEEKNIWTWSIRWTDYFDVNDFLNFLWPNLLRFWWHKYAWWLSFELKNKDLIFNKIIDYSQTMVLKDKIEKKINVDTPIYENELKKEYFDDIMKLWPFWEWNQEPVFLISNLKVKSLSTVWKNWNSHLKIVCENLGTDYEMLYWWKWENVNNYNKNQNIDIIWKIKKDNFKKWFYFDCLTIL